ncbi:DUF4142 domain-containing protein [Caulobacter sp. 17J65-9]|uniref:DUF4142 domain-containing protein n=1 Tax=Caulobacter sp. 17J65-9 TaxID=2709382 RepID=UPI0013CDB1E2|nr:DUF4142 domain-containing protein [Caulobacter sp. 17J65-9]NEX93011.1 DUF4142 domain-containing protein [Caulobacter sp. 17J65-9]
MTRIFVATALSLALAAGGAAAQTAPAAKPAAKAAAPAAKLNDAQIAHIVYTADTIDIDAANHALLVSANPKVRAFAQEMVRDHTAVNEKALALAKSLNMKPEDNPTSKKLMEHAQAKTKDMSQLSGMAFDQAYAANELAYHKAVNAALAQNLIPAAQNAELKALLLTGQKLFKEHEAHAATLVQSLK